MSQFILTDSPSALPGSCFLCGSSNREFFIDLGRSVEFHGAVYICVDECLREIVSLTGFITPDKAFDLQRENSTFKTQVQTLSQEVTGLKAIVDGYRQLNFDDFLSDSLTDDSGDGSSSPEASKGSTAHSDVVAESERGTVPDSSTGEDGAVESSNDETMGDVRSGPAFSSTLPEL